MNYTSTETHTLELDAFEFRALQQLLFAYAHGNSVEPLIPSVDLQPYIGVLVNLSDELGA